MCHHIAHFEINGVIFSAFVHTTFKHLILSKGAIVKRIEKGDKDIRFKNYSNTTDALFLGEKIYILALMDTMNIYMGKVDADDITSIEAPHEMQQEERTTNVLTCQREDTSDAEVSDQIDTDMNFDIANEGTHEEAFFCVL